MSSFVLKIIAMVTMFIDHSGYVLFGKFSFFNYIGRIAFPIFAYQISEGFVHTSNLKKYAFRLFLFAFISQIPFFLFQYFYLSPTVYSLNIFFTLFLGLLCIYVLDLFKEKNIPSRLFSYLIIACLIVSGEFLHVDYGYFGVLLIFLFHLFKNHKIGMNIAFVCLIAFKYLPSLLRSHFYYANVLLCICTMLPILFINFYNGSKGKNMKYFLYAFYPVHLLFLCLFAFL